MADTEFRPEDLADCAERETRKRLQVYPKLVRQRHLSQAQADRQIAMMRAIARRFRQDADQAGRLF